jgi:hypothetical protein
MEDLIKLLKNDHTLYFYHSHNKPEYVRILIPTQKGIYDITTDVAKLLDYKNVGMFLVGPKSRQVETITDKLNYKTGMILNFEDLG